MGVPPFLERSVRLRHQSPFFASVHMDRISMCPSVRTMERVNVTEGRSVEKLIRLPTFIGEPRLMLGEGGVVPKKESPPDKHG